MVDYNQAPVPTKHSARPRAGSREHRWLEEPSATIRELPQCSRELNVPSDGETFR